MASKLQNIIVGIGWDRNPNDYGSEFDLDLTAAILDSSDQVIEQDSVAWYNHLKTDYGVTHYGDNLTGEGNGDDEQISIDFNKLDASLPDAQKVVLYVSIYKGEERRQNFGQILNSFVTVVETTTSAELVYFDLGEDYSIEQAIVVGEFYKSRNEWKFSVVGTGIQGGLAAFFDEIGYNYSTLEKGNEPEPTGAVKFNGSTVSNIYFNGTIITGNIYFNGNKIK